MAKGISDNSAVEVGSIEKTIFPSQHIACTCDRKELFGDWFIFLFFIDIPDCFSPFSELCTQ